MVTDSLIYTLTYAGQSVTRNFACAMPVYTRILACIMSVRVHLCSYACMRNAFRWAPHPPTQPHNSLSDRPPEIYVPTPPLNGSVSSLYIHTHIQVLGMGCNTTSTCTQIEDCERRGHFHFSRRHCGTYPTPRFIKIALYRVKTMEHIPHGTEEFTECKEEQGTHMVKSTDIKSHGTASKEEPKWYRV